MNGLIIVNQEIGHNAYKIKRFKEEFERFGVLLDVYVNDGTLATIIDDKIHVNLPNADFVIYLDKDIYLAKELEKCGFRLFNNSDFIKMCDDKMLTNIYCSNIGVKMPNTIACPLFYSEKLNNENLTFLDNVVDNLGLPLVLKKVYGSLGTGVFLIKTKEELIKKYKEFCREPIQFQEYIKTSYGKSIRILIIDGNVIGGFMRINEHDFRSNYGNTASSKKIEITDKFYQFAMKIAENFHVEYAGIDILLGQNNEPVLCEINSNAFFEEFEKITNLNVALEFVKMVIRKIQNEQK